MIRIDAALDDAGLLKSCRVSGHAGSGPMGGDIVCAAVSVLTRTAMTVLSRREGSTVGAAAPERGQVLMEIGYTGAGKAFLSAAGAFLLEGLKSVAGEYPEYCSMNITEE